MFSFLKGKNNIIAILYVLIVILVIQYPQIISNIFNNTLGKVLLLILIIYITNYSIFAGLTATAIIMLLIIYVNNLQYETYIENMDTMKKDELIKNENDKEKHEQNDKKDKIKPYEPEYTPDTKDIIATTKKITNIDLQQIEKEMKPIDSKSMPVTKPVQNPNPAPVTQEGFCSSPSSF